MSVCLITGAAGGIGRALALRFGRAGHEILGLDVDAEGAERTLDELRGAGIRASFLVGDLARELEVTRLLGELPEGPLAVCIHNAGTNAVAPFERTDFEEQRRVVDLNLRAPMRLTAALLRMGSLASGSGLIFLSSLSHYVGYPGAAAYAASKDGLASYARSLRVALAGQNIGVLTVYPGPTRTSHARLHSPDNSREERRMDPVELAERIHQAFARGDRVLVPGGTNRLFAALGHWLPGLTDRSMKRGILDKLPSG